MLHLSVLDQSVALAGRAEDESIRETLTLARHCEALGYHRFWVSEHHNHDSIVGTAPEILIAAIAATTHQIRVGTAGIMLPNYSTLKVAEQFRLLEAIAPGRIDLGVGRAPGTDRMTAHALNPDVDEAATHFPAHVRDLMAWISDEALAEGHPLRAIRAHPVGPTAPEIWILGSSDYGAQVAAHFGLPYCFAHFITDGRGAAPAIGLYRQSYRLSPRHPEPYATVCVWALAADSEAEAHRLFASRARWRIQRDQGILEPLHAPDAATILPDTELAPPRLAEMGRQAIIGTAAQVGARLRALAESLQVQEVTVLTWAHDPAARRRSYELLAQEFGLAPRPLAPAFDNRSCG